MPAGLWFIHVVQGGVAVEGGIGKLIQLQPSVFVLLLFARFLFCFVFSPHININTQAHKTLKGTLVLIGQQNVLGFFLGGKLLFQFEATDR